MLKIDRQSKVLGRLPQISLSDAQILERRDLQQMIISKPDPFFEEMGEKLFVIGCEVKPSDYVGDAIDILAIDEQGKSVIIELKRSEYKLQLFQAISYAAMLSDWSIDDFVEERSRFAGETASDAGTAIKDYLASVAVERLNHAQRVILIAEQFDYALLKTAEWLRERYSVNIRCYRISYASDGSNEYLNCSCIYPPAEIVDQASRVRKSRAMQTEMNSSSWESFLKTIQNHDVVSFFSRQLEEQCESRLSTKELFFRHNDQRRFNVSARKKHAWVWQDGRFDGDTEHWQSVLSEPLKVRVVNQGLAVTFVLINAADFEAFLSFVKIRMKTLVFYFPEIETENSATSGGALAGED